MLCYRCGSFSPENSRTCTVCGEAFSEGRLQGTSSPGAEDALVRAPLQPGNIVQGRWEIVELVATGQAGWVFRSRDTELDVEVALKAMAPRLMQAADERNRFVKVVKRARKVHHPNIVRIYNAGIEDGVAFYTMPYLEGLTLRKIIDLRVEKGETFALEEILPLLGQLCSAVDHMDRFGGHGSLRPSNVLVLPDILKVTGIPHLGGLPRRPFVVKLNREGLDWYLAPEARKEDSPFDRRADIYSLAVIIFEMMTGKPYVPTTGPTSPPKGWEPLALLSQTVARVLATGWAWEPEQRFSSATALFEALRDDVAPAGPPPPPPPPDAQRGVANVPAAVLPAGAMKSNLEPVGPSPTKPWAFYTAAAVVLVGAIVAGGMLLSSRPSKPPAETSVVTDPPDSPACPRGMVHIPSGSFEMGGARDGPMPGLPTKDVDLASYCIDIYEFPNSRGQPPTTRVTWDEAAEACASRGKRLCREDEWERACKGSSGRRFAMGDRYRASVCNLNDGTEARPSVAPSGEFAKCRTERGVADLAGNVAEWTSSQFSDALLDHVVKGGAANQAYFAGRCAARANESSVAEHSMLGFRCCADPSEPP